LEFLGSAVGAPRPGQQFFVNLLFPFHINSLLVFSLLVIGTIPFLLLLQGALVGFAILPLFFIFTFIIEYAGAIMHARSEGKTKPPRYGEFFKGLDMLYLIKHVLTVAAGITITKYGLDIHPAFGFLIGALCLFILPAALMILAIDRSISRAMNPLLLLSMVRLFLKDYCLFYVLALLLATFFWITFNKLVAANAGLGLSLLWYLGAVGTIYACYAMLGYLMFYYQYDLGNSFVLDKGPRLDKSTYEKLRALGDSDVLAAEERFDDARHVLRTTMDSVDKDLEVHRRYHDILLRTEDAEAINNHTNYYLDLLLKADDIKTASKVYRAVLKRLPTFSPLDANIRFSLAEQLDKELDFQGAITLLRSFHELYPNSELIPQAYLFAAKILHENLHDSHRGAILLRYLVDNHPNADNLALILAYQKKIQAHL
jgi:tetratricopeptide (TPR) repeat protein